MSTPLFRARFRGLWIAGTRPPVRPAAARRSRRAAPCATSSTRPRWRNSAVCAPVERRSGPPATLRRLSPRASPDDAPGRRGRRKPTNLFRQSRRNFFGPSVGDRLPPAGPRCPSHRPQPAPRRRRRFATPIRGGRRDADSRRQSRRRFGPGRSTRRVGGLPSGGAGRSAPVAPQGVAARRAGSPGRRAAPARPAAMGPSLALITTIETSSPAAASAGNAAKRSPMCGTNGRRAERLATRVAFAPARSADSGALEGRAGGGGFTGC